MNSGKTGKILFVAFGLIAVLMLSASAFAERLNEGDYVKLTGANSYAGQTLLLRFNGAAYAGTGEPNPPSCATFDLLTSDSKSINLACVWLKDKVQDSPNFNDAQGYFFKEKMIVTSITFEKMDGNTVLSPASVEFTYETEVTLPTILNARLGEPFDLGPYAPKPNQAVITLDNNFTIYVTLRNIVVSISECPKCTSEVCPPCKPSGMFAVGTFQTIDGAQRIGTGTDFSLATGQSIDLSGYTLRVVNVLESQASFVVTKSETPRPDTIWVVLGNKFGLVPNQSANIYEGPGPEPTGPLLMTLQLQEVVKIAAEIKCVNPAQCPLSDPMPTYYALGSAFVPGLPSTIPVKIKLNDSQIAGNYSVAFLNFDEGSKRAIFAVKKISEPQPTEQVFKLDVPFYLSESQSGISEDSGIRLRLLKVREGIAVLDASLPAYPPCKPGDLCPALPSAKTIYLKEGAEDEAFGYTIRLNHINYLEKDATGSNQANLTVSKRKIEPKIKFVYLDEKFHLNERESASVMRREEKRELFQMKLDGISLPKCAVNEKCDDAPVARIELSQCPKDRPPESACGVAMGMVRLNDKIQFGNYYVFFLGIAIQDNGPRGGTFLVKEIQEGGSIIHVNLDEKFTLRGMETASIPSEGAFIKLTGVERNYEGQLFAGVEIWSSSSGSSGAGSKGIAVPQKTLASTVRAILPMTANITATEAREHVKATIASRAVEAETQLKTEPAYPKPGNLYLLSAGQSIELYGLRFTALDIQDSPRDSRYDPSEISATFIVTRADSDVQNVHVGDTFKLRENGAARVLEANIRIDLYSINYSSSLEDLTGVPISATFSVSNYIFDSSKIGTAVSQAVTEQVVTSQAATAQAALPTTGNVTAIAPLVATSEMPPTPFDTYTLRAGESVNLNEFTIKLVDLNPGTAYFLVTSKASGYVLKMEFAHGWNLFSLPGVPDSIQSDCKTSEWKIFRYNASAKKFERVTFSGPEILGSAFWIYNPGEKCKATGGFRDPTPMDAIEPLAKGWNFIPIVIDMIGKKPTEFSENCKLRAAFFFNANSKKWEKALARNISESDLGKGMAVYAKEACSLSGEIMPPLPTEVETAVENSGASDSTQQTLADTAVVSAKGAEECPDTQCLSEKMNAAFSSCTKKKISLSQGGGTIVYSIEGKTKGKDGKTYCPFVMAFAKVSRESEKPLLGKFMRCNIPIEKTTGTIEKAMEYSEVQKYCTGELVRLMAAPTKMGTVSQSIREQPAPSAGPVDTTGGN